MKAAVVDAVGAGFKIAEVELARPVGREVLIDVRASGLCHTDLTIATQDVGVFPMPVLCGHEVAGVVADVGPQVTEFQPGDRVAACLIQSCGTCAVCLAGRPFQCPKGATLMRGADQAPRVTRAGEPVTQAFGLGGFAAQALIHENQLVKIPNEVTTQSLEMLTVGGALYLIGVAGPDSQVTVNLVSAVLRQPRVVGVNTGSSNFKRDIPLYSRMYLDGRFELDALVSAEISLDQIESGYQKLANPEITRVVITRF
jgi:Zn-dependent alcohol dehydrogenase